MALKKVINYKGYTAEYWRVIRYRVSVGKQQAMIHWALYKDKETRDADADSYLKTIQQPLGDTFINIVKQAKTNDLTSIYTYAKTEFLLDAEDI